MWSLTKYQKEKLAVAQRSMERLMLNITWKDKIRNEVVRSKMQEKDVIKNVQNMKGQWAGHLARINNNKWAKKTMEKTPREGSRMKGRPKRRWRDDIKEKARRMWTQVAQD